ncbi:MAG TPA: histidine kinase dimerization/phosphoacceptor domain-containing protein [Ktedonobacteraceae bacterium]|nr:histidine kinase dimerization/phosphoacceptor domain-containing protein [Ktedonobacteraceae bacterium]
MAASNMLLQLVARLQHDPSVAHGRCVLLDYVRKSSGAHLALLFRLQKKRRTLVLLERSGHRPRHAFPAGGTSEVEQNIPTSVQNHSAQRNAAARVVSFTREQPERVEIPLNGLFGSALNTQGLQYIPNIDSDPRCLKEEKYWTWREGQIIVSPIGTGRLEDDPRGVLVLCFGPGRTPIELDALKEGNLLICITLLSAYLIDSGASTVEKDAISFHDMSREVDGEEQSLLFSPSAAELQAAIDQERSRIARDLHDGAAQNIAHAIHKLEYVRRTYERQPQLAQRELSRARDVLIDTLRDLRHVSHRCCPYSWRSRDSRKLSRHCWANFG